MASRHLSSKIFGVAQGAILVGLIVAIIIYKRRHSENIAASELRLDDVDIRAAIKRTAVHKPETSPRETPPPPLKLESTFPTWDQATPPHEVLGLAPSADAAAIEAAYRMLLKKYHPDRYASWGKGYQSRAHHTILLIQDARDRMLGKKR